MARWLLDANIISAAMRDAYGPLAGRLRATGRGDLCTSVVAAAELRFGASRKGSARLEAAVEAVLSTLDVAPLETPADRIYGALRARLQACGESLGANDVWIAAHAMTLDCVLVTDDRAFERVEGLKVENWLR